MNDATTIATTSIVGQDPATRSVTAEGSLPLSQRVRDAAWWTTLVVASAAFLAHFFFVQLSNMPASPLKYELQNVDTAYVSPFFVQNWSFFAPSPVDRSLYLSAIAEYHDAKTGQLRTTQWFGISEPLYEAVAANRLGAMTAVELMVANAVQSYVNAVGNDKRSRVILKGKQYVRTSMPASIDPLDLLLCTRISASVIERYYPDVHFTRIRIGIGTHLFPRYSKRFERDRGGKQYFLVDWQPFPAVDPLPAAR